MKKILLIVLCILMSITAYADTEAVYKFEYEELGITIIFEENSNFNSEERQYLADVFAYGDSATENSTAYSMCWLTGHDYQYDYISTIEHKGSAKAPRCYKTTYKVETCSKCDHMEYTAISSVFIPCCPED